jgi:hypothetical protein
VELKNLFINENSEKDMKKEDRKVRMKPAHSILFFATMMLGLNMLQAEELVKVVQLPAYWKFSVGDYKEWADPKFNDADWDEIRVPGKWEDSGYDDYNGYAWYRVDFKMYDIDTKAPIFLVLGRIDDVNEVYLNGKLIGRTGSFPPQYKTAYGQNRKYAIPIEYLNYNQINTIAIRVYDEYLEGGIIDGRSGIYVDEDYALLNLDLSGNWKFHLGDNKQWGSKDFNDDLWYDITVPSEWEQQGYQDYDGYAWYRKEFRIPSNLNTDNLYLSLGKIDDYDHVYLNGVSIGSVFQLEKNGDYKRKGYEFNARRIYKIPNNLLNKQGINVISVRVYDSGWRGGIYEGPIGIMTQDNYEEYQRKHYTNQSFWDYVIDEFFVD